MRRPTLGLLIVLLGQVGLLMAGTFLPYEGRLTDATGHPVPDGTYSIRFRLYTSPDQDADEICNDVLPNSCQWQEGHLVETEGGFLTVKLGTEDSFPAGLFNFEDLWLGIRASAKRCETSGTACQVDEDCGPGEVCSWFDDSEMTPRQELGSVPYARRDLSDGVVLLGVYETSFSANPEPPPECPEEDTYSIHLNWRTPPEMVEVLILRVGGWGPITPWVVDGYEFDCFDPPSVYLSPVTSGNRGRYQIFPNHSAGGVCLGGGDESSLGGRWGALAESWWDDGFELRLDGCSYGVTADIKVFVYGHYDKDFLTLP